MEDITHLDLFSGIGGFSIAAKWAGFDTIQFVEIDKFCQKVLRKNFPDVPIHDDIKTFNYNEHVNLLTAGFPCQPFSVAGKRKGVKDDRYLWPETLCIIQRTKPAWVVLENVAAIVEMELDNILSDLERNLYETRSFIIPACAANAPHRRDRVWIIAHRNLQRCDQWEYNRKERHIPKDFERNMAAFQQKWEELKPESWQTMQAREWLSLNAHTSGIDDGLRSRLDRCRSLGNAIVPQVAYPILKTIYEIEKQNDT